MEQATKNGLIASGIALVVVVAGYFAYKKFFASKTDIDNFKLLQEKLGKPVDKNNQIVLPLVGDKAEQVVFYDNNRFGIFKGGKPLLKGTYINGGLELQIDNNGGSFKSPNSVYANIDSILKTLK